MYVKRLVLKPCNSELCMTDGSWAGLCWEEVPDECNLEAVLAKLSCGLSNQRVMILSWTELCPIRDVNDWHADMLDIVCASVMHTLKASHLKHYRYTVNHNTRWQYIHMWSWLWKMLMNFNNNFYLSGNKNECSLKISCVHISYQQECRYCNYSGMYVC